jgi:sterol 24-C-methyltransferase
MSLCGSDIQGLDVMLIIYSFIQYGWGTSFHFSRYYPGEEFNRAIARHEHYLAFKMNIKSNYRVLDVGCGVGTC